MAVNIREFGTNRVYYRNELQNAILRVVKETTDQHLAGLKAAENQSNLLLGAATIGLSGGASVIGGTAARALSAAATGTAGARSLVNEQVYRNTFVESLIALIQDEQEKFMKEIRKRQADPIELYTVEAAIMDAKEYERKGSFYSGLALLQIAVQSKVNTGANPLVPAGQYVPAAPALFSTEPYKVTLPLAAAGATPSTAEFNVAGYHFKSLDLKSPSLDGATLTKVVQTVVVVDGRTTDNQLALRLTSANKTATNVTGNVVFKYVSQGSPATLSIPINVKIGQD